VCLLDSDCAALEGSAQPAARYLARITGQYRDFYTDVWGERGCAMHSALAVAVALDPTLVRATDAAAVTVSTDAATRGMTIWDRRHLRGTSAPAEPSNVTIITEVDSAAFKEAFLRRLGAGTVVS
jgi:purine nucleosidase